MNFLDCFCSLIAKTILPLRKTRVNQNCGYFFTNYIMRINYTLCDISRYSSGARTPEY